MVAGKSWLMAGVLAVAGAVTADSTVVIGAGGESAYNDAAAAFDAHVIKRGGGTTTVGDAVLYAARNVTVESGTLQIDAERQGPQGRRIAYSQALTNGANHVLVWKNIRLADVHGVMALATGASWVNQAIAPFLWTNDGTTATVQFQGYNGNSGALYTKANILTLKQEGDDVYASCYCRYRNSKNVCILGQDMSGETSVSDYAIASLRPVCYTSVALTTEFQEVWRGIPLAEVTSIKGFVAGNHISNKLGTCEGYHFAYDADSKTATVQMQVVDGGWLKVVHVELKQEGDITYARGTAAGYVATSTPIGTDLSSATNAKVAVPITGDDYGILGLRPEPFASEADATNLGAIRIAEGAALDVNVEGFETEDLARMEVTHGRPVFVAGVGPDGVGALRNSVPGDAWGATFGHLVLTGDTLAAGGTLDVRPMALSAVATFSPQACIEGPYTLTTACDRFGIVNAMLDVDKIVHTNGTLMLAYTVNGAVPNGVHLASGTLTYFFNVTLPATIPVAVEAGATACASVAANTSTLNGTFSVGAGATLALTNDYNLVFNGTTTLDGALRQEDPSKSGILYLQGTLAGAGSLAGAKVRFNGNTTKWVMAADDTGFTSKVDTAGVTDIDFVAGLKRIEVTFTGDATEEKVFDICAAGSLTAPQLSGVALTVKDANGADVPHCYLAIGEGNRLQLQIVPSGLVETAVWLGARGGDLKDPANWGCTTGGEDVTGVPMALTHVTIRDVNSFACTNGAPFVCADITLDGDQKLTADLYWRGVFAPINGSVLDLNGFNFTTSYCLGTLEVTSTKNAYEVGELHVEPSGDMSIVNANWWLTGFVRLVKDGPHELVVPDTWIDRSADRVQINGGTLKVGTHTGPRFTYATLVNRAEDPVLVWRNTKLADVAGVTAFTKNGAWNTDLPHCPFLWSNDGTTATVQIQKFDDNYTKVALVEFTQKGRDVYARTTDCRYANKNTNAVGLDFAGAYNGNGNYPVARLRPVCFTSAIVQGTDTLVWKHVKLSTVKGCRALMVGNAISGRMDPCPGYFWHYDAQSDSATVQMQKWNGGHTKCVCLTLRQIGADVWAKATRACYANAQNIPGANMSSGYTGASVATTAQIGGYGICRLQPIFDNTDLENEGQVVIADGARFDANVQQNNKDDLTLTELTHNKTFIVGGAGPDGTGALFNSLNAGNSWGDTFGHIVLTGDTTFGGGRMDLRPMPGSDFRSANGSPFFDGGEFEFTNAGNFLFANAQIAAGRIVNSGRLGLAYTLEMQVPGGLLCKDGAIMDLYTTTLAADFPVVVEAGATVGISNADQNTITGPMTVEAEAAVSGTGALAAVGAFINNGEVVWTSGTLTLGGTLGGSGAFAGDVRFAGGNSRWELSLGTEGFIEKTDMTDVGANLFAGLGTLAVALDSLAVQGTFPLGPAGTLTDLQMKQINLEVQDDSGITPDGTTLAIEEGQLVLKVGARDIPRTAYWTGGAGDGLVTNPGNWACTNDFHEGIAVIPTIDTTIYLTGTENCCTTGKVITCDRLVLPSQLAANCDWRGLDLTRVLDGTVIDLKGHRLLVSATTDWEQFLEVTNSVAIDEANPGELVVEVPEGALVKNLQVLLTGSLKLVKTGEGTFHVSKTGQTYTGGTEVREGTLMPASAGNNTKDYAGDKALFGALGSTITVQPAGIFDINGNYMMHVYRTVLNGGTYQNTRTQTDWSVGEGSANIVLTADSAMNLQENTLFRCTTGEKPIELGGHTLTVTLNAAGRYFYLNNTVSFQNGTVDVVSGGWFDFYRNASVASEPEVNDCRTVNFRMAAALMMSSSAMVRDWTEMRPYPQGEVSGADTTLTICGRFTPSATNNYIHNAFTLASGSKIDLSEFNEAWSITGPITKKTLAFADGARISIDLGDRAVTNGTKVIDWSQMDTTVDPPVPANQPANWQTLKFTGPGCSYSTRADGVYVHKGFTIFLR